MGVRRAVITLSVLSAQISKTSYSEWQSFRKFNAV